MKSVTIEARRAGARPNIRPPAAVEAKDISKTFRIPHRQYHTLKERALHPFRSNTYNALEALRDVSFEVAPGEFFGIVGRNGSGKSTLLKCLAGIYDIDVGQLALRGRLSPFIELGVGFNMELTARDNVIVSATMLGLSRRQARERFDAIIEFAGLERFLDLKLKNYSSGMQVRLAFATAIQVDAEILLIDEVLAVGDAAFQQKCYDEFFRLKDAGRTILFVTHDMGAVQRFCDRAMLIEQGQMVSLGEPDDIARDYNELNFGREARATQENVEGGRFGDGGAEIQRIWCEDADGVERGALTLSEPCAICFEVRFDRFERDPLFAVEIANENDDRVAILSSFWGKASGDFQPGDRVVARLRFRADLRPGRYTLSPGMSRPGSGTDIIDHHVKMGSILIHGTRASGGIAELPHEVELERE